jgi:hypothetical protein
MNYAAILESVFYWGLLLGMPCLAVGMFLLMFVHQSEAWAARNRQLDAVRKRAERAAQARVKHARLLDPLFRFKYGRRL